MDRAFMDGTLMNSTLMGNILSRRNIIRTAMLAVSISTLSACVHYASLPPLTQTPTQGGSLLISNARVFDGDATHAIREHIDILVKDGRIVKMAPHPLEVTAESRIDAQGKLVMPGLIDMHVHIGGTEAPPWRATFYPVEHTLSAFLAFGVTSIVDMGGIPQAAESATEGLEKGEISGPRLVYAGRQISVDKSHPGPLIETSLVWPVGKIIKKLMLDEVSDETDFDALIQERKAYGASFVKLMIDHIPLNSPAISPELAKKTVDSAHKQGLLVAAHIGDDENIQTALNAGVDLIAHSVYRSAMSEATLEKLKSTQTPVISTLRIFSNVADVYNQVNPITSEDALVMDPNVVEAFKHPGESDPDMREYAKNVAEHHTDLLNGCRALRESGAPMLLGTDTPLFGAPAGSSAHAELAIMVEKCGYSAREALAMATGKPGAIVGQWLQLPMLGTVQEGAPADLLIVNGDPTVSIGDIAKIDQIISRGQRVESSLRNAN
ncbi:MAG: amidohydrolase family protein [Hahellaceae bacterium]|nr:amidohydrolase family protein [Hahellaceae bacterium]